MSLITYSKFSLSQRWLALDWWRWLSAMIIRGNSVQWLTGYCRNLLVKFLSPNPTPLLSVIALITRDKIWQNQAPLPPVYPSAVTVLVLEITAGQMLNLLKYSQRYHCRLKNHSCWDESFVCFNMMLIQTAVSHHTRRYFKTTYFNASSHSA